MTHDQLVKKAKTWLKVYCGCSSVATEIRAITRSGEIPDALGFQSDYSILVECKVSREDFLADRKKIFRQQPELGMGDYRFFLAPKGLISVGELPDRWGLVEVEGRSKPTLVHGPNGNIWSVSGKDFRFTQKADNDEWRLLVSLLRRAKA